MDGLCGEGYLACTDMVYSDVPTVDAVFREIIVSDT